MTLEELSRVLPAMGIQSDLPCFFSIDKQVDKEHREPFCNGGGSLRVPIFLEIGLQMDEKSSDERFLAIGGRGETGYLFRRDPDRL